MKIGVKIASHLSANVSIYAPCARYIFWLEKNMAALSELILQMDMYFHAGCHVKLRRVKTRMQMRVVRKEHKNNERRYSGLRIPAVAVHLNLKS